ncbi:MAG: extracellular solute-binding protein [Fidelibacterota bacterium]|nr:MAG: extracellular solute-binding protein [Candidatus Neomarinimicrobiota bacterium]
MIHIRTFTKIGFFTLLYFLAGCGKQSGGSDFDPASITGPFRWDRAAGETIKLHLNKHPFTESLVPTLDEFTELTGIAVEYSILSEEEYREKIIIELSSQSGSVDVFMTGPFTEWSYVRAGWLEPLESYLANPALTNENYDPDDFFPVCLTANRWNGKPGYSNYGLGSQWAIPVQVETYILAFRKDWAADLQLTPPGNYKEYYRFAKAMTRDIDGRRVHGVTARGIGTWSTIATGFLTGFASSGCRDFDDQMNCTINSPEAVAFTEIWIRTLKESGPLAWTSNSWYDTKEQFESGQYGMWLTVDFFAVGFENLEKSRIARKVGYTLAPAGPDGKIRSNMWTWALAVNRYSRQKLASWLFVQWATSKEQLRAAALAGNWNPSRQSVWDDPQVASITAEWDNYRAVVSENLQNHASVCFTPQPEVPAIGDRWARALQEIWSGTDAQIALDRAAADIDRIIEKSGMKALIQ